MVLDIEAKFAAAVLDYLSGIRSIFGEQFAQVFKIIIGDNGSDFDDLSTLVNKSDTKIYFTHPYSSFEKGTNERHNDFDT